MHKFGRYDRVRKFISRRRWHSEGSRQHPQPTNGKDSRRRLRGGGQSGHHLPCCHLGAALCPAWATQGRDSALLPECPLPPGLGRVRSGASARHPCGRGAQDALGYSHAPRGGCRPAGCGARRGVLRTATRASAPRLPFILPETPDRGDAASKAAHSTHKRRACKCSDCLRGRCLYIARSGAHRSARERACPHPPSARVRQASARR